MNYPYGPYGQGVPGQPGQPQQPGFPQQQGFPPPGYPQQPSYPQQPGFPQQQGFPPPGYPQQGGFQHQPYGLPSPEPSGVTGIIAAVLAALGAVSGLGGGVLAVIGLAAAGTEASLSGGMYAALIVAILFNFVFGLIIAVGAVLLVQRKMLGRWLVVGACALQKTGEGRFELTKMGVRESARGRKAGEFLLHAMIRRAHERGAETLYLLTSARCGPAIHLYEKTGFAHDAEIMRDYGARYQRCDVAMRYVGPPDEGTQAAT